MYKESSDHHIFKRKKNIEQLCTNEFGENKKPEMGHGDPEVCISRMTQVIYFKFAI